MNLTKGFDTSDHKLLAQPYKNIIGKLMKISGIGFSLESNIAFFNV